MSGGLSTSVLGAHNQQKSEIGQYDQTVALLLSRIVDLKVHCTRTQMCLIQLVITLSVRRSDGTNTTEEEKSATCSVNLKNSDDDCGILYQTSTTHTKRSTICRPSRLQTRLLHDEPLAHIPATQTHGRRMAPDTLDRIR